MTRDDYEVLALGQLGMKTIDFYNETPRAFFNRLDGDFERSKYLQQQKWERTRWSVWHLLNIQIESGKKLKLKDIAVFPWEDFEEKKATLSKEEAEKIMSKWQL